MAKSSSEDARMKALETALKEINKSLKSKNDIDDGPLVSRFGDKPRQVPVISSGSFILDSLLGGGFAKGRIIEIYGHEGSGKTSIALTAAAGVQKAGGVCAFIDMEHALDPYRAETLGVDMSNMLIAQPAYAEKALNLVLKLIKSEMVDLIIVDSVAAMTPLAELEGDLEDQTIGLLARIMSRALRRVAAEASRTGTTVIFINQTREKVGTFSRFGTPETTPGGRALKFMSSQRIQINSPKKIKEGDEAVALVMKFKVEKNKIAAPFKSGETNLTFDKGIDIYTEIFEKAPDYGVIERPNNRTYVEAATGEVIGKSKDIAFARLKEDAELFERVKSAFAEAVIKTKSYGPEDDTIEELDDYEDDSSEGSVDVED